MTNGSKRRILCVFPRYARSFGTFHHAFPLVGVKAFMPPQGLLAVAAYLPGDWEVRLVDENVREVRDDELGWADAVLITGMHVQREHIGALNRRAHAHGRLTVLGGPSVSGEPDWYPDVDILHVGEVGDATRALVERLARGIERPDAQEVYRTAERVPLAELPRPAYEQLDMGDYFLANIQFSSGCPYRCEFCDIPELYGRKPRLKTPEQVTAELDAILERGNPGAVYFVDDNFVGNPKAARPLLEALVQWQERRGFPLEFACEATLNLAKRPELLELMRDARFTTVFCGIETPEEDALRAMKKQQNLSHPILESIRTLNAHGMEVVSGIIVGLDTDTPGTYPRITEFIEASGIPMLTINVLFALPRTPLWRRLEKEGRLIEDLGGRESNVEFLLPREVVIDGWRGCIERAYEPRALFRRFEAQMRDTYPNRRPVPASAGRATPRNILRGIEVLARTIWHAGVRSRYRREFWRMALPALRRGQVEELIHAGVVAHHLILFARECAAGSGEQAFYSPPSESAGDRSREPRELVAG